MGEIGDYKTYSRRYGEAKEHYGPDWNEGLMNETNDVVNHPKHYTSHPSGVECIDITEHMDFCIGNAIKYLWRAGLKDEETNIIDLQKAIFYINRKIKLLEEKGGK